MLVFPTCSNGSSATSRSKRQRGFPHGDDHSDGPRPRSSYMRATAYRRLFARGMYFARKIECQFRSCQDEPGLKA
ncbi:hypothetical protein PIB30_083202 [Stylosanthes scabra]|uniref:Uncharacterized protein n=1 Tax=Stylosanthes scabra TaxID=79078 RepID=A0ABU6UTD3_9FABA|nr:hypothetical protein [Stylosanthes scabra]